VQEGQRALWRTNIAANVSSCDIVGLRRQQFQGEGVTIHSRLKSAAADLHVEVASTLDFDKITKSAAAYSEASCILYLVFDRLQRAFRYRLSAAQDRFGKHRVPPRLACGGYACPGSASSGSAISRFRAADFEPRFGCLYVLEGSALGGQIISKRVKQTLGVGSATGGAYFLGLGRQTASHWSDFLTALNAIPANSTMGADAEAGAIATFLAFRQAISLSR
jgi:heme oxygenase (biliverdin-IX-beta and delta-forming)